MLQTTNPVLTLAFVEAARRLFRNGATVTREGAGWLVEVDDHDMGAALYSLLQAGADPARIRMIDLAEEDYQLTLQARAHGAIAA